MTDSLRTRIAKVLYEQFGSALSYGHRAVTVRYCTYGRRCNCVRGVSEHRQLTARPRRHGHQGA